MMPGTQSFIGRLQLVPHPKPVALSSHTAKGAKLMTLARVWSLLKCAREVTSCFSEKKFKRERPKI